ncbi:MAG: hypothetical protein EOO27_20970 [Comamonadaceae bacterium]|nr:MAG: hypothetical protein EOO27_20970 [Comamonadaceae bacterium]
MPFQTRAMTAARHVLLGRVVTVCQLAWSAPALATTRCPPEFGPKDPIVNGLGWAVVALAVALAAGLVVFTIRRTRGTRLLPRAGLIGLAIGAAAGLMTAGMIVAVAFFFMRC